MSVGCPTRRANFFYRVTANRSGTEDVSGIFAGFSKLELCVFHIVSYNKVKAEESKVSKFKQPEMIEKIF
jgi:hypothetical protein